VGAPHSQTVNAAVQWIAEKTSADPRRQFRQFLGRFLQEEQVGTMLFDKSGYILDARAGQTQQVPAYDFQISGPRPALFSSSRLHRLHSPE
jgi:hypothetical protein